MRHFIVLLLGIVFYNGAGAVPLAAFQESLYGRCQGEDVATGFLDDTPEAISLDMRFAHFSGECQLVSSLLINGSQEPVIDLQISASATTHSANLAALGNGTGRVDYYFQASGPAATSVEIEIFAAASISGSRNGQNNTTFAHGSVNIFGLPDGGNVFICSYFGPRIGCATGPAGGIEQTLRYTAFVMANVPYQITMIGTGTASALGGADVAETAEVQVIVDPRFRFVNPGDAELYTLEFSPNMAAVPLPATAWLLGAGVFALAGRRLRLGRRPS